MPRRARVVAPGYPHHVTQRGVRGQKTFLSDDDYRAYLDLLLERKRAVNVGIWAYCLMPNHVHFVAVPQQPAALARLFGLVHKRYADGFNAANGYEGHLWQQRFYSVVMDEPHLLAAVRYVELNPVRAGLCRRPQDWPWSSAPARLAGTPDRVLSREFMDQWVQDWAGYLQEDGDPELETSLRASTRNGWPRGNSVFLDRLERVTGCRLRKHKPGPPSRRKS